MKFIYFAAIFLVSVSIGVAHGYEKHLGPLRTFKPPDDANYFTNSVNDVMRIKGKYVREKYSPFPDVSNLLDFACQVCGNLSCFTVIDNFRNVGWQSSKIPIIIRNHEPLVHRKHVSNKSFFQVVLAATNVHLGNTTLLSSEVYFACPTSHYLIGLEIKHFIRDVCIRLNLTKVVPYMKPYNLQIHMGIFPPDYIVESKWLYPKIFHFGKDKNSFATPMRNPINVIVRLLKPHEISLVDKFLIQERWIDGARLVSPSLLSHDIFLIVGVIEIKTPWLYDLKPTGRIAVAEILKVCQLCVNKDGSLGTIRRIRFQFPGLPSLKRFAFSLPHERIMWNIFSSGSGFKEHLLELTMERLTSCLAISYEELRVRIFSIESIPQKVAVAHSQVLLSVMGNYTFGLDHTYLKSTRCTTHQHSHFMITFNLEKYPRHTFIFPYYPADHLSSLRFIGCGSHGVSSLAYQELINVYDPWVWGCIAAMLMSVPLLTYTFTAHTGSYKIAEMSILKILVEQSDPFPQSISNNKSLQCLLGIILLMGIILSNGYKSTNVYNMVQHRAPKLYKYFDELIRDNFKIYSRSLHIFLHSGKPQRGYKEIDVHFDDAVVALLSETEAFLRERQHTELGSEQKFRDFIRVHPHVISKFEEVLADFVMKELDWRISAWQADQLISQKYVELQKLEMKNLLLSINECQKSAVILPNYMCLQMQNALVKSRNGHLVFVGQESYSAMSYMFQLSGLVPPFVLRRIHWISESGIWEWWMRLLGERRFESKVSVPVKAATMKGNIIIIFELWLSGTFFSVVCCILEFCRHDIITRSFIWQCAKNKVINVAFQLLRAINRLKQIV